MGTKDNTAITHHDGGTTYTGDAITLYRWKALQQAIILYTKTGLIPTRGVTISKMLKAATEITSRPYKNTSEGRQQAVDDLQKSIATLKMAIPHEDERKEN